ncbi:MAG: helix-turn-helix domain protein [Bacteriophage sp.]|nr:MAG: helix-turn-helix domain protein [Bacteriophage sp.]
MTYPPFCDDKSIIANLERKNMGQQHKKWIQLVKDKLNEENMTQTHLARACGVKKPTISELLKYGKGSDKLKNRVCDVLRIDASWVDLEEE